MAEQDWKLWLELLYRASVGVLLWFIFMVFFYLIIRYFYVFCLINIVIILAYSYFKKHSYYNYVSLYLFVYSNYLGDKYYNFITVFHNFMVTDNFWKKFFERREFIRLWAIVMLDIVIPGYLWFLFYLDDALLWFLELLHFWLINWSWHVSLNIFLVLLSIYRYYKNYK